MAKILSRLEMFERIKISLYFFLNNSTNLDRIKKNNLSTWLSIKILNFLSFENIQELHSNLSKSKIKLKLPANFLFNKQAPTSTYLSSRLLEASVLPAHLYLATMQRVPLYIVFPLDERGGDRINHSRTDTMACEVHLIDFLISRQSIKNV